MKISEYLIIQRIHTDILTKKLAKISRFLRTPKKSLKCNDKVVL